MAKTCSACGSPASGQFCSQCGASLEAAPICAACGNQLPPGGRFCNRCGVAVAAAAGTSATAGAASGPNRVAWYVAGAAILALTLALALPRFRSGEPPPAPFPSQAAGVPAGTPPDLSSMTPREAADRLYDRIMVSLESGDTAQARTFLPMGLAAYQRVGDLDLDGHYHVAVLHLVNEDAAAAQAEADLILQQVPTHLFGLLTAAEAESLRGNEAAARDLYSRFLENYENELATARREYTDHAPALPPMREQAASYLGQ